MTAARTRRKTTAAPAVAFFFGAGAEVSYRMPTGGRFALEVIKRSSQARDEFVEMRRNVDASCTQSYRRWLPSPLMRQRVSPIGSSEHGSVFGESLESGYERVIEVLDHYDEYVNDNLSRSTIREEQVRSLFDRLGIGTRFGDTYDQIEFHGSLGSKPAQLYASKYFSALINLAKAAGPSSSVATLTRATNQFYLGAHGQGTMNAMTTQPLLNVPEGNPAFDELGHIFQMHRADAGQAAFDLVMKSPDYSKIKADDPSIFESIGVGALESTVLQFLDYRETLDKLIPGLFQPRRLWAKFTKACIFLMATRRYVMEHEKRALEINDGYYHDLAKALRGGNIRLTRVGTANYTDLCSSALADVHRHEIIALNGRLRDYLDPYKNEIVGAEEVEHLGRFAVPFLFTQSGVKPLTSVTISRRYVDFYDAVVRDADAAVVVGFGFNADDGHINTLFRQAMDRGKRRVVYVDYAYRGYDPEIRRQEVIERLRLDDPGLLTILPVDAERRIDGRPWLQAVLGVIQQG